MGEVVKGPFRPVHKRIVPPREMYKTEEPPDEMVWAICPHLRVAAGNKEPRCQHCPRWEDRDDVDGEPCKTQRMCYGLAAETCRVIFAMQRRMEDYDG